MSGLGPAAEVDVGPKGNSLMERNEINDDILRLQHTLVTEQREIGHLVAGEVWWRDRFSDIESLGYGLRSRYHPNWQPSWMASGRDFFTAEDGLATIVSTSTLCAVLPALDNFYLVTRCHGRCAN